MSGRFTPDPAVPTASTAGYIVLAALLLVLGASLLRLRWRESGLGV